MGFWWFMLIMDLLIPCIMIIFGQMFRRHAPRKINPVFGYRTTRSMKNRQTWEFAHHHCGKVWLTAGIALFLISGVVMLLLLGKSEDTVSIWGGVLCVFQTLVLIVSIFPTEIALRNRFDKDGHPKCSNH